MNLFKLFAIFTVIIGLSDGIEPRSLLKNINDDRVMGGQTATPGQLKYQVSLRQRSREEDGSIGWSRHRCGGSIISNRWIISAAHCTQGSYSKASNLAVAVGAHHIQNDGEIYLLDRLINHPAYNKDNLHYDLCLLRTIERIQFNNFVQSIPLRRRFVGEGMTATVSGWGKRQVRMNFNNNTKMWFRKSSISAIIPKYRI